MSAPACRTRLDRDCEVIRTRERCGWLSDPSVTRRPSAVYARASKTNLLPEPASLVRHAAQAVVGSARARGGRRAHADRVRPSACSFCIGPSTARTRPSSARGSASSSRSGNGSSANESRRARERATARTPGVFGGTGSSNPPCSSSQSVSTVNPGPVGEKPRTLAAVCGWLGT
jgi:hypothetical protein